METAQGGLLMRILVVEDEIHLAEALTLILRKNNYSSLNSGGCSAESMASERLSTISDSSNKGVSRK
jgi:DNA-binding response OmpR family regulator